MNAQALTFGQKAALIGAQVWSAVQRAVVGLVLIAVSILVGGAAVTQSSHPPDPPWWAWGHWVDWFNRDRQSAVVLMIGALGSGGGFALSIFQVWFSTGTREAESRHAARMEAMERRLAMLVNAAATADQAAHAETHELLRSILRSKPDGSGPEAEAGPDVMAAAVAALRSIQDSPDAADQRARALFEQGEPEGAFATLRAAARAAQRAGMQAKQEADADAAEKWRRLGALAYLINVGEAIQAYENAAQLSPGDVWTFIFLSRLYQAAGSIDESKRAARSALSAAHDDRDRMCALNELGDLAVAEGDLAAARRAFEDGLAIAKDLSARDPGNTVWRRDLSISYNKLGGVAVAEGDLAAARRAFEDGLAIAKDLSARDPGNTEWRRDLSVSYNKLGDVAVAEGDLAAARRAFEDGLAIRQDLSARDPGNTEWRRDLSVSYDRLGDVAVAEGDLAAARRAFEDGLAIAKDLSARDPGNTAWRRDLSVSYEKLGDVAVAEGDLAAARRAFEDGLAIRQDLSARDPGNTEWRRDLSISYNKLGDVAVAEGDLAAARRAFEDGLAIAKDLSARDPGNTGWRRDLSVSYEKLGDVAVAEGDLAVARRAFEDGLAIRRDLGARDPGNARWRRDVWTGMWRLARLPDGGVTWPDVHRAIQAERDRGTLLKGDEGFLIEAARLAAS